MQNGTAILYSLAVYNKIKHIQPYDPEISFVGINPGEMKTYIYTKPVYEFYRSSIHKCQKLETTQVSFFSRWIDGLLYIHVVEYYATIRRNELLVHVPTEMNLKCIMQNERNQTQKINII